MNEDHRRFIRFVALPVLGMALIVLGLLAFRWREDVALILIGASFFVLAYMMWPGRITLLALAQKVYESFVLAIALLGAAAVLLGLGRLFGIDLLAAIATLLGGE